eukprot:TRINITY_DN5581_c0_g1_i1.p1 TRINITY_DN5581_c0_g1~~TRINITY_DN5581_c0_g1_i1.p1  ORF type:complete len:265 (+),score=56.55 TRINITY_DN5581_c0_g1_i1:96-890(+)
MGRGRAGRAAAHGGGDDHHHDGDRRRRLDRCRRPAFPKRPRGDCASGRRAGRTAAGWRHRGCSNAQSIVRGEMMEYIWDPYFVEEEEEQLRLEQEELDYARRDAADHTCWDCCCCFCSCICPRGDSFEDSRGHLVLTVGGRDFRVADMATPLADAGVAAECLVDIIQLPFATEDVEAAAEGPLTVFVTASALGCPEPACLEVAPGTTLGELAVLAASFLGLQLPDDDDTRLVSPFGGQPCRQPHSRLPQLSRHRPFCSFLFSAV